MLTNLLFTNRDGSHSYTLNSDQSPASLFDVTVQDRVDTSRDKMEYQGVNATLPFRGGMEIHVEGSIIADDSASYVTQRKALVAALFGLPTATPSLTLRKNGTLQVGIVGESEDWDADCVVLAFTAPVRALYPGVTEYAITFFSWNPYFIGHTTPTNRYYWS